MHLGMSLGMRQVQECVICHCPMTAHKTDCPQGMLAALYERCGPVECPKCRKQKVYVNRLDHFECLACKAVFAVGYGCGYDVEKLPVVTIQPRNGEEKMAVVLPDPGTGDIPILERFEDLSDRIDRERRLVAVATLAMFLELQRELKEVRDANKGKESEKEDRILDRMDDLWNDLDEDQRKDLNEPRKEG